MSPAPRRDLTPFAVALGAGAIFLFLLVGGLASVPRDSGSYHATVDGSFGAQAGVVATESNVLGAQLRTMVGQMVTDNRSELGDSLDALVAGAQSVAASAQQLASPAPDGSVGPDFVQAMTARAEALQNLRDAVDGLLMITPDASAPGGPTFPPPAVSVNQAIKDVTGVGVQLIGADRSYALAAEEFAKVPGGSALPRSRWITQPVLWGVGAVETTIDQLSSSPVLTPVADVQLAAIALRPAVLPPAPGVAGQPQAAPLVPGASEIPPTCTVSVTAVVENQGSVVVSRVPVKASVQPVGGSAAFVVRRTVTLAPGASRAVSLPPIPVTPAVTYTLTVSLQAPAGEAPPAAQGATIAVASFGSANANQLCAQTRPASP